MKRVVLCALMVLLLGTLVQAGEPANKLRLVIGRETPRPSDFTDVYRPTVGLNYEHLFTSWFGLQGDYLRSEHDPDAREYGAAVALHAKLFVAEFGTRYDELGDSWSATVATGVDGCSGHFCSAFKVRYRRLVDTGSWSFEQDYTVSAEGLAGVRW